MIIALFILIAAAATAQILIANRSQPAYPGPPAGSPNALP